MPWPSIKRIREGDVSGFPDSWTDQGVRLPIGTDARMIFGLAKLTSALQTAIPIYIPSWKKDQTKWPDKLLTLPVGAQITFAGFRLPTYKNAGEPKLYGQLADGCTIVGTNGEKLKLSPTTGTTYTQPAPSLTVANGVLAPDGTAVTWRAQGVADAVSPSILRTLAGTTTLQLTSSNAGDTAVGTGIALSTAGEVAYVVVMVCAVFDTEVPRIGELGVPVEP